MPEAPRVQPKAMPGDLPDNRDSTATKKVARTVARLPHLPKHFHTTIPRAAMERRVPKSRHILDTL